MWLAVVTRYNSYACLITNINRNNVRHNLSSAPLIFQYKQLMLNKPNKYAISIWHTTCALLLQSSRENCLVISKFSVELKYIGICTFLSQS